MNIANKITLARIAMIPFFIGLLMAGSNYIATAVFVIAAATDGLDGYFARARNEVTNLGRFLDPLADKLLIISALVYLVEINLVAAWIAIIIVARELAVTGLRTIAVEKNMVIEASKLGKFKTVSQIAAVIALLLHEILYAFTGLPVGITALYVALLFTVLSGVDYFIKAKVVFDT